MKKPFRGLLAAVLRKVFMLNVIAMQLSEPAPTHDHPLAPAPKTGPLFTDPLKIDTGYISGTVAGEIGREVHLYRGIPYAAPPVGKLRWQIPQPADSWAGTRECTTFSSASPQPLQSQGPKLNTPEDEDCLYLNVYSPARHIGENLPVMVWMHGGGYWAGSGNEEMYNNLELPRRGVVLVTVNMRLGALGLPAHPLLSRESSNGGSGNYMFMDMIAALKWVRKNIATFGGNPDNVTIIGESGGGAKVSTLIASPLAKGLFHRAICESGAAFPPIAPGKSLADMEAIGKTFFAILGVDKEKDSLAAARSLPWRKIVEADSAINRELNVPEGLGVWDGTVDGWVLPDTVANIFQAGRQNVVPLITCANLGELTGPSVITMPWIIPAYTAMLSSGSQAGAKVYACIFDQVPEGWRREGCVAIHAIELPYIFGTVENERDWVNLHALASSSGARTSLPEISDADKKVARIMMNMWANFAGTGDPGVPGLIEWPVWERNSDKYLYVHDALQVKTGYSGLAGQF